MTHLVRRETRALAWLEGVNHVLDSGGHTFNLILDITHPLTDGSSSARIHRTIDDYLQSLGRKPLNAIAETIFPGWSYRHRGFDSMCDAYFDGESAIAGAGKWGTYAERILRRETPNDVRNPLGELIGKMKTAHSGTNAKRSCYELDVAPLSYDIATFYAERDGAMIMGQPCLAHLSFKLDGDQVHLTALYRSHDYALLALGNFLGLARLQSCVAREVGATVGTLVIHSTYAFVSVPKARLRTLVSEIEELA